MTAGLEIIGEHVALGGPAILAVVTATVHNAGKVRHTISAMHFDLRIVEGDDLLVPSEQALGQAAFPRKLYDEQRFFPKSWVWSFVDPGVTNVYRYSVILPADARFALVSVKLPLAGDDEFFASWKIVDLPQREVPSVMSLSCEEMNIPTDPYESPNVPTGMARVLAARRTMI